VTVGEWKFTAEDFASKKMPRRMSNGNITVDCLLLDDVVSYCNARIKPLLDELSQLQEQVAEYENVLNFVAAWEQGTEVNGTFDSPHDASVARSVLKKWRKK
jgi:hypothetical protein